MGFFSSSSDASTSSGSENAKIQNREDRARCWEARDAYFGCLDAQGVVKAGAEEGKCAPEEKKYGESCAKSWIEYFNQRRIIADAQKDRLAQAATQAQNAKR